MLVFRGAALALMCLLAGCVAQYRQAAASSSFATFEFEKGYESGLGFGRSTAQAYSFSEDETCGEQRSAARFSWASGDIISRRVAAGAQANLIVDTTYYETTGVSSTGYGYYANVGSASCRSLGRFTPIEGHTYRVVQHSGSVNQCALNVVDQTTGSAPPDLVIQDHAMCWSVPK